MMMGKVRHEPDNRLLQGQRTLPDWGDPPLACRYWRPSDQH